MTSTSIWGMPMRGVRAALSHSATSHSTRPSSLSPIAVSTWRCTSTACRRPCRPPSSEMFPVLLRILLTVFTAHITACRMMVQFHSPSYRRTAARWCCDSHVDERPLRQGRVDFLGVLQNGFGLKWMVERGWCRACEDLGGACGRDMNSTGN